jgi:hypothetical protein
MLNIEKLAREQNCVLENLLKKNYVFLSLKTGGQKPLVLVKF